MSLSRAQALVEAFHVKYGVAAPLHPQEASEVDWEAHTRRINWMVDETDEGDEAIEKKDVAELADFYIDALYFALGGLVELGIDGGPLFDAVNFANMQKVKLPGVAKIAKPPGWKAPPIAELIEQQRKAK